MNYTIMYVFVFIFAQAGMGHIIDGPKDTEAVVGTQVVLRCQTDVKDSDNPVEWYFKANDYEAYNAIYKEGLILNGYQGRMKVEANVSSGHYDLVIFNISLNNAGAYTCLDDSFQQRAGIIVFEQYPSEKFCSLTKPSGVIIGMNQCNMEPDKIEISCKLRYQGNLKPHLEWFNGKQLISSNSSTTDGIITSTVLLRADKLHSLNFNCRVAYENNMASMFNWTTTVSVTSISDLTTVMKKECHQTQANCSTLSNLKCSSVWIDNSNNTVANGSLLGLGDLSAGNYTCIATCSLRERPCSFVREQIVHTCDSKHKNVENLELIALLVIALPVFLCVATIVMRRLKRYKQEENAAIKRPKSYVGGSSSRSTDGEQGASVPVAPPVSTRWETNGLLEQQNLLNVQLKF